MKNIVRAIYLSQKGIQLNTASKTVFKPVFQQKCVSHASFNSLQFTNKFRFSTNYGESDLKNLSQILKQNSSPQVGQSLYQVQQQVENVKMNLTNIDVTLLQEFHKRLVDYYTQQRELQTDLTEKKRCNALILQEFTQLYLAYEELEYKNEVVALIDQLAKLFDEVKNDLIFSSPQFEFDYFYTLSQIFTSHKRDEQSFEVFRFLQEKTPQEVKQAFHDKYLDSQCERVTLSQVTRNHDQVFDHLDILFSESDKLTISKENQKLLSKLNQYFLRGVLLSTQFDREEKGIQYQEQQKKFISKYNYQASTIEKLTLQVKEISEKTPNYIQVKGEQVNQFVENHKLEFSKNVQDILIYQLYNQVVPLNLFEYFYMLVKFESNYREEVDEVPMVLTESPEDLVEDFEEIIISNIQTLLEIRKLIRLFTKEVIEIDVSDDLYSKLEISSWISHIKPHYQVKIKDVFKNINESYV